MTRLKSDVLRLQPQSFRMTRLDEACILGFSVGSPTPCQHLDTRPTYDTAVPSVGAFSWGVCNAEQSSAFRFPAQRLHEKRIAFRVWRWPCIVQQSFMPWHPSSGG